MWMNVSLACKIVCVLLAELASLPSAYLPLGPPASLSGSFKSHSDENAAAVFEQLDLEGLCERCCLTLRMRSVLEVLWPSGGDARRQTCSQR